jgi:hypothetical protein
LQRQEHAVGQAIGVGVAFGEISIFSFCSIPTDLPSL